MKHLKINWFFTLMLLVPILAIAGGVFDQIAITLKAGNAKELAKHFDSNVEITILDKEDVYSKAQAELVVKDFFNKYPPTGFELIHQGASDKSAKYGIGSLVTTKGTFRAYVYVKEKGSVFLIQELRFEEE